MVVPFVRLQPAGPAVLLLLPAEPAVLWLPEAGRGIDQ
jgi:hypothetical protein